MSKWVLSGKTRLTLVNRWFQVPLLGLQSHWEDRSYYDKFPTSWEIAGLSSLTEVPKGLPGVKAPTMVRYRAHKAGLSRTSWLVMQICDDPDAGTWRDAKVEDLGDIAQIGIAK